MKPIEAGLEACKGCQRHALLLWCPPESRQDVVPGFEGEDVLERFMSLSAVLGNMRVRVLLGTPVKSKGFAGCFSGLESEAAWKVTARSKRASRARGLCETKWRNIVR